MLFGKDGYGKLVFNKLQTSKSPARYFCKIAGCFTDIIAFNPHNSPCFTEAEMVKQEMLQNMSLVICEGGVNSNPRLADHEVYTLNPIIYCL